MAILSFFLVLDLTPDNALWRLMKTEQNDERLLKNVTNIYLIYHRFC